METNTTTLKSRRRRILMFPWLAHGHVSPFLALATELSERDFTVYFCSTPVNLNPIRHKINPSSIEFVDLHLPQSLELPPHYQTTKDLPPHLMPLLKAAFDGAKPHFVKLVKTLNPDLVVYDFLQPWVPGLAAEQGIPSCLFLPAGTAACSFLAHQSMNSSNTYYPFPAISFQADEHQRVVEFMASNANDMTDTYRFMNSMANSSKVILVRTSREIEDKYIKYLSELMGKRVVPVGFLTQKMQSNDNGNGGSSSTIMNWLNQKEEGSSIFVSFGSEYFLKKEEIEEIAYGLELSNVGFIWVIRFPCPNTIHEVLPEGFLQRIGNRGMVVDEWAPQVEILQHSSIGGFVSHCGWGSLVEAVTYGVPLIAMPLNLDQPLNAKLAVEIGVAMEVVKEEGRFGRKVVARVIREVLVGEEGKKVKEKAKELKKRRMEDNKETDAAIKIMEEAMFKSL